MQYCKNKFFVNLKKAKNKQVLIAHKMPFSEKKVTHPITQTIHLFLFFLFQDNQKPTTNKQTDRQDSPITLPAHLETICQRSKRRRRRGNNGKHTFYFSVCARPHCPDRKEDIKRIKKKKKKLRRRCFLRSYRKVISPSAHLHTQTDSLEPFSASANNRPHYRRHLILLDTHCPNENLGSKYL